MKHSNGDIKIFKYEDFAALFYIKRTIMAKIMQNLVFLMEPSDDADKIHIKGGNMCLNRFCIDEDAAFELSGVNYLMKTSGEMIDKHYYLPYPSSYPSVPSTTDRKSKGKG